MPSLYSPDPSERRLKSMESCRGKVKNRYVTTDKKGNEVFVTSATELLGELGLSPSLDGAPRGVLEEKTIIGNQIHEINHAFFSSSDHQTAMAGYTPKEFKGAKISSYSFCLMYFERTLLYWKSFLRWWIRYRDSNPGLQVLSTEGSHIMMQEAGGSGSYPANLAGTWDLFLFNKSTGLYELKDYKLCRRQPHHRIQLAMYAILVADDERYPMINALNCRAIRRTCVMIEEGETYEIEYDDPHDIEIACAALLLHGFMGKRKKYKKVNQETAGPVRKEEQI